MNVLILSPDRVGATLLQRLLTVYMQLYDFDKPVINLQELTNGLIKYYSPEFNRELLSKPFKTDWGYHQTPQEIATLLESADHYKVSKLSYHHMKNRNDSPGDCAPLYDYLNENFFIISAQRDNLLDHALSWAIFTQSKHVNSFSHLNKIESAKKLLDSKLVIDPLVLKKYLNQYIEYLQWVDRHFVVGSYFKYEKHVQNLEKYILDLPMFPKHQNKNWHNTFGITFEEWNRCHYLVSDTTGLGQQTDNLLQLGNSSNSTPIQIKNVERKYIPTTLSENDRQLLATCGSKYTTSHKIIEELVENKVLTSHIPIKLQTMIEKKLLIQNFDQCVDVYNQWAKENGVELEYSTPLLDNVFEQELKQWHTTPLLT